MIIWIYFYNFRPAKDRLRGYFRLSSRRSISSKREPRRSCEDSITQENTTTTSIGGVPQIGWNSNKDKDEKLLSSGISRDSGGIGVAADGESGGGVTLGKVKSNANVKTISEFKQISKNDKHDEIMGAFFNKKISLDPLTNSCSNITSSTYCNNGTERDISDIENASSIYTDKDSCYDKKPLCDDEREEFFRRPSIKKSNNFHRNIENVLISDRDLLSRKGSTTTLERDMEIIDQLERERSMDIQEMIAKERRAEALTNSRQNSLIERRRKLPDPVDYNKYSMNNNVLLSGVKEINTYNSYTSIQPVSSRDRNNSIIENIETQNPINLSRKHSRSNSYKRTTDGSIGSSGVVGGANIIGADYDQQQQYRINRSRGSGSSRGSTNSRDRKLTLKEYRNNSGGGGAMGSSSGGGGGGGNSSMNYTDDL